MNTENPNDVLARRIVDRLVAGGLVRAADGERLAKLLATGSLKENDWRALLETAWSDTVR